MTGASQYRIQASSRDEALRVAFSELRPDENTRSVIVNTLREEGTTGLLDASNWKFDSDDCDADI